METSPLDLYGRVKLFSILKNTLSWQELEGRSKLPITSFLTRNSDSEPYKLKYSRLEAFMGKTIGGLIPPAGFKNSRPNGRSFDEQAPSDPKVFTINDKKNASKDYKWPELGDDFKVVLQNVVERLREALVGTDAAAFTSEEILELLQCNVNLYARDAELKYHRDDGTRTCRLKDQNGNSIKIYEATDHTFFPAAVTVILTPNGEDSHKFILRRCPKCFEDKKPMYEQTCAQKADGRDSQPEILPRPNDKSGIICLKGRDYLYGVHGIEALSNAKIQPQDGIARMSLNFRIVRKSAWDVLDPISSELHKKASDASSSRLQV